MAIDPKLLAIAESVEPAPGDTARFMETTEALIEATCTAAATAPEQGGCANPDALLALLRRARSRLAFAQESLAELDSLLAERERRLVS